MISLNPRAVRYGFTGFVLFWMSIGQLSVAVFVYQLARRAIPVLPAITVGSLTDAASHPVILGGFGIFFVGTTVLGQRRYGSLSAFAAAVVKHVDEVLGYAFFDEPLIVGCVRYDDTIWRLRYWEDDRVEIVTRECPFCSLELSETVLPARVVHAENTAFDPSEETRATQTDAWEDVFGAEKADDRKETFALACPQCNFSIPGKKDVHEGQDGARAKFRQHIDRMTASNPADDPFASYVRAAETETNRNPSPEAIWDEYARSYDADDVCCVGIASSSVDGTVGEQSQLAANTDDESDTIVRSGGGAE